MARVDFREARKKIEAAIKNASKALKRKDLQDIGNMVIADMKSMISKGTSPIRGRGRFPGYKDSSKYPAKINKNYPDKRPRPVNLKLSGDFLDELEAQPATAKVYVGFWDSLSKKKESGHREGVGGQPSRPIIPSKNEEFALSITKKVEREFEKKVDEYLDTELKKI